MKVLNILEHSFIPNIIPAGSVIFDCGANQGEFARWCDSAGDYRVYSFEPDPRLFQKLPNLKSVKFIEKAIDGKPGDFYLALGEGKCSSAIYKEEIYQEKVLVPKIDLGTFCKEERIDSLIGLIKLDIEGSELNALENLEDDVLNRTVQMTVEFHDFLCAEDIPRIEAIVKRIKSKGFEFIRFSHYTWGDCLFINKRFVPVSRYLKMKLLLRDKYLNGLKRNFRRRWNRARHSS